MALALTSGETEGGSSSNGFAAGCEALAPPHQVKPKAVAASNGFAAACLAVTSAETEGGSSSNGFAARCEALAPPHQLKPKAVAAATALPPDVRRWLRRAVPWFLHWALPMVRAGPLYFNCKPQLTSLPLEGTLVVHRYLISQDSPALYITVVTNNRLPVFQKDPMKEVLCRAIDEARKHFLLFAYVVMLDHVHLLTSRPSTTSDVLRVLKGLTARRVLDHLKGNNYLYSLAKLQHQERDSRRAGGYQIYRGTKNS